MATIGTEQTLPLVLFAVTAKLWIQHVHVKCTNQDTIPSDECNHSDTEELEHQWETDEERRMRRNLRLSIDNPDFSRHHFYDSPTRTLSGRNRANSSLRIGEEAGSSSDSTLKLSNSVTFLNAECPRWRKLMERVSIADSVLTRVSCFLFERTVFCMRWRSATDQLIFTINVHTPKGCNDGLQD
jgi:hypothetical protein